MEAEMLYDSLELRSRSSINGSSDWWKKDFCGLKQLNFQFHFTFHLTKEVCEGLNAHHDCYSVGKRRVTLLNGHQINEGFVSNLSVINVDLNY